MTPMTKWIDLPPTWLIGFMFVAWATSGTGLVWEAGLWPGRILIATGLGVMIWSMVHFQLARTTVIPRQTPTALVDSGPFHFSRNPIYLADLVILAGWCLNIGAPVAVILVVPFWWVLQTKFIEPEEETLEEILGAPYLDYKARVRRWI